MSKGLNKGLKRSKSSNSRSMHSKRICCARILHIWCLGIPRGWGLVTQYGSLWEHPRAPHMVSRGDVIPPYALVACHGGRSLIGLGYHPLWGGNLLVYYVAQCYWNLAEGEISVQTTHYLLSVQRVRDRLCIPPGVRGDLPRGLGVLSHP